LISFLFYYILGRYFCNGTLFAIIEKQNEEVEFLKPENQKLRDEINLLKGEQTKPKIRGSKKSEGLSTKIQ